MNHGLYLLGQRLLDGLILHRESKVDKVSISREKPFGFVRVKPNSSPTPERAKSAQRWRLRRLLFSNTRGEFLVVQYSRQHGALDLKGSGPCGRGKNQSCAAQG